LFTSQWLTLGPKSIRTRVARKMLDILVFCSIEIYSGHILVSFSHRLRFVFTRVRMKLRRAPKFQILHWNPAANHRTSLAHISHLQQIAGSTMNQHTESPDLIGPVLKAKSSNFKALEDCMLALAYAFVTTNAAIVTDQDGNTFWTKIRDNFIRRGGLATRTMVSLKNRFNKVLQAEVNKYIGNLKTVFSEHHSGWSMEDYVAKAKNLFLVKNGKYFKHEQVYIILKEKLPKYEIPLANIDSRVARALFLLDSDDIAHEEMARATPSEPSEMEEAVPEDDDVGIIVASESGDTAESGGTAETVASVLANSEEMDVGIPRPTIGKKKAKLLIQTAALAAKKRNNQPVTPPPINAVAYAVIGEKKKQTSRSNVLPTPQRQKILSCRSRLCCRFSLPIGTPMKREPTLPECALASTQTQLLREEVLLPTTTMQRYKL
jgi:hypothetical protein